MADSFEDALDPVWKNIDSIRKTTQVLKDHFGINGYTFFRIDYSHMFFALTDIPQVSQYMRERKYHLNSPCLRHPDSMSTGFRLREPIVDSSAGTTFRIDGEDYYIDNILSFFERTEQGIEGSIFWGKKDNADINSLALNCQPIVKRFIHYFKQEHQLILLDRDGRAVDLSKTQPEHYFSAVKPQGQCTTKALEELVKVLGMEDLIKQAERLSPRERECLRCVLQGKSAKASAKTIPLSHRTVEAYLDTARRKLDCKKKQELFKKAEWLAECNFL